MVSIALGLWEAATMGRNCARASLSHLYNFAHMATFELSGSIPASHRDAGPYLPPHFYLFNIVSLGIFSLFLALKLAST